MIPTKHLKLLPYHTLKKLAIQLAADIDNGGDDKRNVLALVFEAIKVCNERSCH